MRLLRSGEPGQELPCLLAPDGRIVEVGDVVRDYDAAFFAGGGLARLAALAEQLDDSGSPAAPHDRRIGPPIARPGKVICIGLNYADHAAESGAPLPSEPVVFAKAPNTVVGPYDDVLIPVGSEKTDWEVELGVVIAREARYLPDPAAAADVIAGYTISNDLSERAFQLERGGQWFKGKSCETFNPLGPWLVTPDEIGDPQKLGLWLEVNRQRVQDSSTAKMVFGVLEIVHYLSQFMVLEPGDLINTGTPAGVGLGMDPPRYLRPGDVMKLGIDGMGTQRQTCRQAEIGRPDGARRNGTRGGSG